LLPDLLTARKAKTASRLDATSVTEAETAALPKARLRAKLVADLVQSRTGTSAHEVPVEANEPAQIDPNVLYRKGDASATGFRPASWSYEPPSVDHDEPVFCLATANTRDPEESSSGKPSSPPVQRNLSDLLDPLREGHRSQAGTPDELDEIAIARLLEPTSNTVPPIATSERVTDPPKGEIAPSSAGSHLTPDHTAVTAVPQTSAENAEQVSRSEAIITSEGAGLTQSQTVAPVLDDAAIARLLEPIGGDPDVPFRAAQPLGSELRTLVTPPPRPRALVHEATDSSNATTQTATPEWAMREDRIELRPSLPEPARISVSSPPTNPEDVAASADVSGETAEALVVSVNANAYAELGALIENVLTERHYGSTRELRSERTYSGSLMTISSDSLLDELQAAKHPETALPKSGEPFPFLGAGAIAAIAAVIGCAVWALFSASNLPERLMELLS